MPTKIDEQFAVRRKKLFKKLSSKAIAIIPSAVEVTRNSDVHFDFRQDSTFFYYTGFDEPDSFLVLIKSDKEEEHIFVRPSDPHMEMWLGKRLGVKRAASHLKMTGKSFDSGSVVEEVLKMVGPEMTLYIDLNAHRPLLDQLMETSSKSRLLKRNFPKKVEDLSEAVSAQRLIKDTLDIEMLKRAAKINTLAHRSAMQFAGPGRTEYEVHALMKYIYHKYGAPLEAYSGIVASGNNANTLHYIANKDRLRSGDLLLADVGCELHYYASDVTRTFPINGKFSKEQELIYQIVLKAQKQCIEMVRPGVSLKDLNEKARFVMAKELIKLGIFKGKTKELSQSADLREVYPHSLSHWLGLDVHDIGDYVDSNGKSIALKKGMVITVEPGLYFNKNNKKIAKEFRGIGIRIEDNILVTSSGYDNLTKDIPKEVSDVERECRTPFSFDTI